MLDGVAKGKFFSVFCYRFRLLALALFFPPGFHAALSVFGVSFSFNAGRFSATMVNWDTSPPFYATTISASF